MARPTKNNADYFSHDSGMRNDRKIKAIRSKYGIDGYAIWCMFLEVLSDAEFFRIKLDDIEIEMISGDFGVTSELLKDVIDYCTRLGMLKVDESGKTYSSGLCDRLQTVLDKRANMKKKYAETRVSAAETTQSKVKESKVNKIKETIKQTNGLTQFLNSNSFEYFWSRYPKKTCKADALEFWNHLVGEDIELHENINRAIEWQKKTGCLKEIKYAPKASEWLKSKRWEDEEVKQELRPSKTLTIV